jgi:hypothetical protein
LVIEAEGGFYLFEAAGGYLWPEVVDELSGGDRGAKK